MGDLSGMDPTGRFTGFGATYARHRPTYPAAALDLIAAAARLGPGSVVVDVGCGTGISARLMAERGYRVIGVEPNDDMRRQAEAAGGSGDLEYRAGRAEATGLPDGTADLVLAAQAFHWFDAPRALAEFHRVLRPGGVAALLGNERDEADPFTHEYGGRIRALPGAAELEAARARAGDVLHRTPLFEGVQERAFPHEQALDGERLVGRAFSASYVPRDGPLADNLVRELRGLFERFGRGGVVRLRYVTTVIWGRARKNLTPPAPLP